MGIELRSQPFLGVDFAHSTIESARAWVESASGGKTFSYVVTPNVDHLVMLNDDGTEDWRMAYREAVASSDLCVNDSRVLQQLARLSGIRLGLVPGSDLARNLLLDAGKKQGSIALVGGNAREAHWLSDTLPNWRVVHCDPPMGVRDNPDAQTEIAEFVEREGTDYVFLAIGAPQSEIVAHLISRRGLARGVALCIGASIEFLSGTQRRAPQWMQSAGLEWLFRLGSDPKRLWRRYLQRGPRIFAIWLKASQTR